MFGNFIYFIIVLLIYTTYQPTPPSYLSLFEAISALLALSLIFTVISRHQFRRIRTFMSTGTHYQLDHKFNSALNRQSILAIVLFAAYVHGLNLPSFFFEMSLFASFPTLLAAVFITIFLIHLVIVWGYAYDAYREIYQPGLSQRTYIVSNLSFNLPVFIPWLLLSGMADLINFLPFATPKAFLATTEGQIIYFVFFLFFVALFGPAFIQKFWRCTPLEPGPHRRRIESLCYKAGFKYANILYWPIFGGRMITAGVMGLVRKFRYLLVTEALLRFLNPNEIDAVVAHEVGHIKKNHLVFYLIFFGGFMLVSFSILDVIYLGIMYLSSFSWFLDEGVKFVQSAPLSIIFSVVVLMMFLVYFRFIFGYFMRNFERQADIYVYQLFDSALPLITTLNKIALTSGQPADKPNWHHFSIAQRVDYLKKCESDRKWIMAHNRKVRLSITLFFSVMLIIGYMGYQINFGEAGKSLNQHFFERIVLNQIEASPHNAILYRALGDIYYSQSKYADAIASYERALALNDKMPEVLNSLAWLYATCEDEAFRQPETALALAKRAVQLKRSAHILDTLAESYFINGFYDKAVETATAALSLAAQNRQDYQAQLERFQSFAKNKGK